MATSPSLDRILRMRPSNVVARFGSRSRLPVLDPRDLLSALISGVTAGGGALLSVRVPMRDTLPGILRAARELDAPLGLACPQPAGDRQSALVFTENVVAAATEIDHARPLYLEAGPLRVPQASEAEAMVASVSRCVEAGFTLISLQVGALSLEEAIEAVRLLAAPVMERDLSLELDTPAGVEIATWLERLRQVRVSPALLRLPSPVVNALLESGAEACGETISSFAQQAEAFGVALSADEPGPGVPLPGGHSVLAAAGVRKLSVGRAFARPVIRAIDPEIREQLAARAKSLALSLEELIALIGERLPGFEGNVQTRVEALCFGETVDLIEGLGLRGSARRLVDALATRQG